MGFRTHPTTREPKQSSAWKQNLLTQWTEQIIAFLDKNQSPQFPCVGKMAVTMKWLDQDDFNTKWTEETMPGLLMQWLEEPCVSVNENANPDPNPANVGDNRWARPVTQI